MNCYWCKKETNKYSSCISNLTDWKEIYICNNCITEFYNYCGRNKYIVLSTTKPNKYNNVIYTIYIIILLILFLLII